MQQGPTRRKTIEFEAAPGWQDAPQTLDTLPVPSGEEGLRPHVNLKAGAVTFPDVGALSFRVAGEQEADWRAMLPYSIAGFALGWIILGFISWAF